MLANDPSGCAKRAVVAFLDGGPLLACSAVAAQPVDPLPPVSFAGLAPAGGLAGEPGQVLTASVLTIRHDVLFTLPYASFGVPVNGTLAGGLIPLTVGGRPAVFLEDVSYVPSVTLSGGLRFARGLRFAGGHYLTGRVKVRVDDRAYGTIRLAPGGAIAGTLGGTAFKLGSVERKAIDAGNGLGFYDQLP